MSALPDATPLLGVDLHDDWLRITFPRTHADFHYVWLRHNAGTERHPTTGEQLLDSSEIAEGIRPTEARIDGPNLVVRWSDGTLARYDGTWLDAHAYAKDRVAAPPPPSNLQVVELDARDLPVDAVARAAKARVEREGVVVVRGFAVNGPEHDTEALVAAFEETGLAVIGTHFGRIEDLRPDNTTNQNTDQLGYTDAGIDLHTDQPFLDEPPRYQLLQAIVAAESGGDNFVVDAQAAAAYLAGVDARDHELLTTVPVRFHRKQKAFEREVVSPVLSPSGAPFAVRFSYFTMAPHQVPFPTMRAWYRAYNHFTRVVRDPAHQYRFKLAPGDFVLYDNRRMLHGRSSFRGPRWLRGVYFAPP